MRDLDIPEKLAEVSRELGRLFCLRGGCRNQQTFWPKPEQSARASLIYFTADVLSALWPLSWGQQFRKWRGGSTWLCHIHLFNWSDLICNRDCKPGMSPEWQLLFSLDSSPGLGATWILLCSSHFCFLGLSPLHFSSCIFKTTCLPPSAVKF